MTRSNTTLIIAAALLFGCESRTPEGLGPAAPAATTVAMDFYNKPLPEIPLPNDVATRYDATSATGRRINASLVAPTEFEKKARASIDGLDGWGTYAPITIPFTAPIDVYSVRDRHCIYEPRLPSPAGFEEPDEGAEVCVFDPDQSDDAVYLVNVDRDSDEFGRVHHLDVGHGNYPIILEDLDAYWDNDPRDWLLSVFMDEEDEDLNGDGILQPEEDTDSDGVLDVPNYFPGMNPPRDDLKARADALMSFYDRETRTLVVRPMMPLRERTTYAVLVTRRILDEGGEPVGSPFRIINHESQTADLKPLLDVMPEGLAVPDIAFAFTFSTQTIESGWKALRDGLYGHGVQAHLAERFPAEIATLEPVRDAGYFDGMTRPTILPNEHWAKGAYGLLSSQLLGSSTDSLTYKMSMEHQPFIDYHVVGSFDSPQLFERYDEEGHLLPLDEQIWPEDLETKPVHTRGERVHFWLAMPRKEVSVRGEGKPVPVVILGHGYGSQRFEALEFAPYFAKLGIATLAIDCVSHGIGINEEERKEVQDILSALGLKSFMEAILTDRAFDQNGDSVTDSGADFWTGYMFHTRDVVRQSALDYMQLVRVFQSFDGTRRWNFDIDGDGEDELAGDFDADGVVDVGLGSLFTMTGGSLGGIMTAVVGSVEPAITVAAPLVGGGGLADIGNRSLQGGVREAVVLRAMGPVFWGNLAGDSDVLELGTVVPDLNDDARELFGSISGVQPGDTLRVTNLRTGESGCGLVQDSGRVRAAVGCNIGDPITLNIYGGAVMAPGDGCELLEDAELVGTLDTFEDDVVFQGRVYRAGTPLRSVAEGLGKRRSTPGLRRFLYLAQHVLDPADPGVLTEFMLRRPFTYAGTGEQTGTHMMAVTTLGDMNVPASGGVNLARSAGLVDFLNTDSRWGKTPNQVLLETGVYEAVHTLGRYHDVSGAPVHLDVENFSQGIDPWLDDIPRLDEPVRLVGEDAFCDDSGPYAKLPCGVSGLMLPHTSLTGKHGFDFPGQWIEQGRARCENECTEEQTEDNDDPCGCENLEVFDIGTFIFHTLGRYLASGGAEWNVDLCNGTGDCGDMPEPLKWRDDPTSDAFNLDELK
ncbi:MAG: hypothetical protein CL940_07535 [Deltaproteobacteria bacterium]|nr:hypothetical protein [Deltaproteobacteria bacterium]